MSGGESACLLGCEDPHFLYQAFQGWTGQISDHTRDAVRVT